MSVAQVIDASPAQVRAIEVRNAFLKVSHFLDMAEDDDNMIFAEPLAQSQFRNTPPQVFVRDYDDVLASMRGHLEAAFDGGPEAAYHDLQHEEELKALGERAERQRSKPQIAPMYLIDA